MPKTDKFIAKSGKQRELCDPEALIAHIKRKFLIHPAPPTPSGGWGSRLRKDSHFLRHDTPILSVQSLPDDRMFTVSEPVLLVFFFVLTCL